MRPRILTVIAGVCALGLAAATSFAGPLEQVNLDGSAGHDSVRDALFAVDDGGVIEIVEAGTYSGFFDPMYGPANFTVRKGGSVSGDVILTNSGGVVAYNTSSTTPSLYESTSATFEDLIFRRTGGSGPVIDIDQSNPVDNAFTVGMTLNNCVVEHTGTAGGDGGEALKLDDGYNGGALVTLIANNTQFSSAADGGDSKATIRVQDPTWQNLTVQLTDCVIASPNYRAIRNDGGDNQNWTFDGCDITGGPGNPAILLDDPHDNCSFTFVDTSIVGTQEAIKVDETNSGNSWSFDRCHLETTGTSDVTVRLRYSSTPPVGNTLEVFNSVIVVGEGTTSSTHRGFHVSGLDPIFLYNNTFVGTGTGSAVGINGDDVSVNAYNNLFLNFLEPSNGVMGGSYSGIDYESNNNIIVGPEDDDSKGAGGAYIVAAAGLSNALAAAGLDSSYEPMVGSSVIDAGGTTNTLGTTNNDILATLSGVDFNGNARDASPDVGAFELITSVQNWNMY